MYLLSPRPYLVWNQERRSDFQEEPLVTFPHPPPAIHFHGPRDVPAMAQTTCPEQRPIRLWNLPGRTTWEAAPDPPPQLWAESRRAPLRPCC